jgi:hypothetical protein
MSIRSIMCDITTKMPHTARRSVKRLQAASTCENCKILRSKCSGFSPCTRCVGRPGSTQAWRKHVMHHAHPFQSEPDQEYLQPLLFRTYQVKTFKTWITQKNQTILLTHSHTRVCIGHGCTTAPPTRSLRRCKSFRAACITVIFASRRWLLHLAETSQHTTKLQKLNTILVTHPTDSQQFSRHRHQNRQRDQLIRHQHRQSLTSNPPCSPISACSQGRQSNRYSPIAI